jgi:hypothetical protein
MLHAQPRTHIAKAAGIKDVPSPLIQGPEGIQASLWGASRRAAPSPQMRTHVSGAATRRGRQSGYTNRGGGDTTDSQPWHRSTLRGRMRQPCAWGQQVRRAARARRGEAGHWLPRVQGPRLRRGGKEIGGQVTGAHKGLQVEGWWSSGGRKLPIWLPARHNSGLAAAQQRSCSHPQGGAFGRARWREGRPQARSKIQCCLRWHVAHPARAR